MLIDGALPSSYWLPIGKFASALNSTLPGHALLALGGFLMMSGYRPGEISGNHLADLRTSLAAMLGLRTLLGPVYCGIGTRGSSKPYFYLEVGPTL